MRISYIGHSCFEMESKGGVRVITDPYDSSIGIPMPRVLADVVTISHGHGDHNNTAAVLGNAQVISGTGDFQVKDVQIRGIASHHDDAGGRRRGRNIIFRFLIDGLSVCHLGDLGHVPDGQQIEKIGHVDVLLVPVGEIYTFSVAQAMETIRLIDPVVVIPMHYHVKGMTLGLSKPEKFLSITEGYRAIDISTLELTQGNIGDYKGTLLLRRK